MGYFYSYNDGQYLFDRIVIALWTTIKLLFNAIVYVPLLLMGYIIASLILDMKDSGLAWVGLILLFAYAAYLLLYFMKGMLIAFKYHRNLCWIPILIVCMAFTTLIPVWFIYEPLERVMFRLSEESGNILTKIVAAAFGLLVYSRYHFLTDITPVSVFPAYRLGIDTAHKLLCISSPLKGKRSDKLI